MHFLQRIVNAIRLFPNKMAIVTGFANLSYAELCRSACTIAQQLLIYTHRKNNVCVIISEKSVLLYQSMLACFFSNLIYTPINVYASLTRNKKIIQLADADFILMGDCRFDLACQLLCSVENKTVFVLSAECYELLLQSALPHHFILLSNKTDYEVALDDIVFPFMQNMAYLFFTSGSTGVPKGVPIAYHNISAYVDSACSLFRLNETDRVLQSCDIAFDLSLHEIFTAWCVGATLYVYDESHSVGVANYIDFHKITHAIFVPSAIPILKKQCAYFHLALTSLKKIFFCGEAFPLSYARLVTSISPHAAIVNLYGPTEATIACTYHFYRKNEDYDGLQSVPIGFAFPTVSVKQSDDGELMIDGEQVFQGYWPLRSEKNVALSYDTGDFVSFDERWGYVFQTRKDDQWQIQGYRIEKNEVEHALRSVLCVEEIYVAPQYHESGLATELLAFSPHPFDMMKYKKQLALFIPSDAIPHHCIQINNIPKLPNGKVDYKAFCNGGACA